MTTSGVARATLAAAPRDVRTMLPVGTGAAAVGIRRAYERMMPPARADVPPPAALSSDAAGAR